MRCFLLILTLLLSLNGAAQDQAYHGDGPDDYLRFVPIVSVCALKACGVESASSWKRLVVNTAAAVAISSGTTLALKHAIHERRPDGTDRHSFPSGHATFAFAGATILHKEYGHLSPWISVAGYGVATLTGVDRVLRNRHHWGDVVAGAAIGVLGTELGYWLGDKLTGEHSRFRVGASSEGVQLTVEF